MLTTSIRPKKSEDSIDENVDLQEPETQKESSEVNASFVCGAKCCANGDIAYHKEYLDDLDLAKVFAKNFDRNKYYGKFLIFLFLCVQTFYH